MLTNQVTRPLAALRESQSLPPLTRAWLSLITLTLRALGRNHTVSAPCEGTALFCSILCQHAVRASQCFVKTNIAVSLPLSRPSTACTICLPLSLSLHTATQADTL